MTLEKLYKISKNIDELMDKDVKTEMTVFLNKEAHEALQQEVYNHKTKTMVGYKSEKMFNVIIYNTKYNFKIGS
jgi:hypothetical protein